MSFDRYFIISMPTLNWIGKEAVVNHDKEVPFRLLRKVKSSSVGDNSQNLVIHGDNLEALKALMPYYVGKVKCIYIDPPYNTGNEKWVYNDKVNSPKIKKWFGKVVGGQSADLCRHDKWLCMMYPRLKLLRDLLAEDGVIFISIDDNEHCSMRGIADEIFGNENFLANLVWANKEGGGSSDSKNFRIKHEYIVVYSKNIDSISIKGVDIGNRDRYKQGDEYESIRGPYYLQKLGMGTIQYSTSLDYAIQAPDGTKIFPKDNNNGKKACWRWSQKKLEWGLKEKFIEFKKDKNGIWQVYTKQYLNCDNEGKVIERKQRPFGVIDEHSSTQAAKAMQELFDSNIFSYSKPVSLIKYLISLVSGGEDIILDSFAGSGTTGHAVLDLNKEDGGERKFILVELEEKISKDITAERVKRAIKKYDYKDGFEYCELDKPLFDEQGQIEETCEFNQFATYIYFTETQTNIDKNKIEKNFIGEHNDTEFYLIYKEKDKNILTKSFLSKLRKNGNKKVVYADKNYLDEDVLLKYNITFKQIPYEVKVY